MSPSYVKRPSLTPDPNLGAEAILCSVVPSGNQGVVRRQGYLKAYPYATPTPTHPYPYRGRSELHALLRVQL